MKEKMISQHYLKTGILGAYETAGVDHEEGFGEKYAPCFDDSVTHFDDAHTTIRRTMAIGDRHFRICSVFTTRALHTPTDKLLSLIDTDLEKPDSR